jgi:hypothetical protein
MSYRLDGVDDFLNSDFRTMGNVISLSMWINHESAGPSPSYGRVMSHGQNYHYLLQWVAGTPVLSFYRVTDNTPGSYSMATGFATIPGWKFVAVVSDGPSGSPSPPIFYVWDGATYPTLTKLTAGAGLTVDQAQFGNPYHDGYPIYLGTEYNSGNWAQGAYGEFAWWNRLLTDAEVAAIYTLGVMAVPDPIDYLPLDGGSLQNFGKVPLGWFVTGALPSPNPPIRPAGRRG